MYTKYIQIWNKWKIRSDLNQNNRVWDLYEKTFPSQTKTVVSIMNLLHLIYKTDYSMQIHQQPEYVTIREHIHHSCLLLLECAIFPDICISLRNCDVYILHGIL